MSVGQPMAPKWRAARRWGSLPILASRPPQPASGVQSQRHPAILEVAIRLRAFLLMQRHRPIGRTSARRLPRPGRRRPSHSAGPNLQGTRRSSFPDLPGRVRCEGPWRPMRLAQQGSLAPDTRSRCLRVRLRWTSRPGTDAGPTACTTAPCAGPTRRRHDLDGHRAAVVANAIGRRWWVRRRSTQRSRSRALRRCCEARRTRGSPRSRAIHAPLGQHDRSSEWRGWRRERPGAGPARARSYRRPKTKPGVRARGCAKRPRSRGTRRRSAFARALVVPHSPMRPCTW